MSLNSLLINKAKIKSVTPGDWGEPSISVGPELPCRIEYGNKRIVDYKGEERVSKANIFFKAVHMTFNHNDKIQLDIESYLIDHAIILIDQPQNSLQIHHGEVYIV